MKFHIKEVWVAVHEIQDERGKKYDPSSVKAFVGGEYYPIVHITSGHTNYGHGMGSGPSEGKFVALRRENGVEWQTELTKEFEGKII